MSMIKVAIIGSQGVPAQYGGFETLVENLLDYLKDEFEITIFCSSQIYKEQLQLYKGCRLEYVNLHPNGVQSIFFDIFSLIRSVRRFDKILILGVSGGIILPFLRPYYGKFILNIGGLDWQRSKWNRVTRIFLKISERFAIINSKFIISDNIGIREYILKEYKKDSTVIEYGGDHVDSYKPDKNDLVKYGFLQNDYAFSVARIQPDNNIDIILDAFKSDTSMPIVFVGNWANSDYGIRTKSAYSGFSKIILLEAIYDKRELNLLRSNCTIYIHGHSAGGTNPALVEAMSLGLPVIAFSSVYNVYTTQNSAIYFKNTPELLIKINSFNRLIFSSIGESMKEIASTRYTWKIISEKYSDMFKLTDYEKN